MIACAGDDLGTKDSLEEEPYRPGPPSTGPGIQTNEVVTSQYTWQNFIFKNLWKQFHRPANVYFLFISGLQCIKVREREREAAACLTNPGAGQSLTTPSSFLTRACTRQAVSITGGVPTTILPLLFVLFVTALKDAIEDFNR